MPFREMEADQEKAVEINMSAAESIYELTQKLDALIAAKKTVEDQLQFLNENIEEIETKLIPDKFLEAGMSQIKLKDGRSITIKEQVYASISQERRDDCFKWLEDHDCADIITTQVQSKFTKGQEAEADMLMEMMASAGVNGKKVTSVHPATLRAFVTRERNERSDFPDELFGVFTINRAIIK